MLAYFKFVNRLAGDKMDENYNTNKLLLNTINNYTFYSDFGMYLYQNISIGIEYYKILIDLEEESSEESGHQEQQCVHQ